MAKTYVVTENNQVGPHPAGSWIQIDDMHTALGVDEARLKDLGAIRTPTDEDKDARKAAEDAGTFDGVQPLSLQVSTEERQLAAQQSAKK